MTSTRAARKSSRVSSPLPKSKNGNKTPVEAGKSKETKKTFLDEWVEPPIRPPAPSFEDYKGLERQGVLESMAPLGTFPKEKHRPKARTEISVRNSLGNSLEVMAGKDRAGTESSVTSVGIGEQSDGNNTTERSTRNSIARQKEEDPDYTPGGVLKSSVNRTSSAALRSPSVTGSATGRPEMDTIVGSAIKKSNEIGQTNLASAIQKLYEETKTDPDLAALLDAVLNKSCTKEQGDRFRSYLKAAKQDAKAKRKAAKARLSSSKVSPPYRISKPMNPPSKHSQSVVGAESAANSPTSKPSSEVLDSRNHNNSQPHDKENSSSNNTLNLNGSAAKMTRSKSPASTSSLSSLSSPDPEIEPPHGLEDLGQSTPDLAKLPTKSAKKLKGSKSKAQPLSKIKPPVYKPKRKLPKFTIELTDEEFQAKRAKLKQDFSHIVVGFSDIRESPSSRPAVRPSEFYAKSTAGSQPTFSVAPPSGTIPRPPSKAPVSSNDHLRPPQTESQLERATRKRSHEAEDSATAGPAKRQSLHHPELSLSRSSTPALGHLIQKKSARVKVSPNKKKSAVIAGVARSGNQRSTPVVNGSSADSDEENNDYCSTCGGNGELLCCDGCIRSFHFSCADPPEDPQSPPEGEWYCNVCTANKEPPQKRQRGLFSSMLDDVEAFNPVAYSLPRLLREYYEGVKTGEEGEFEETVVHKLKTRGGYAEPEDTRKQFDSKNQPVLCYYCGKSTMGGRQLIQCDYCHDYWHLDCLDPPLANPPIRASDKSKPRSKWQCPNHIDGELSHVKLQHHHSRIAAAKRPRSGRVVTEGERVFAVRRPKNAKIFEPALRRGYINNGIIEVEDDSDDDQMDVDEDGAIPRLSSEGIKLDFIDRAKQLRASKAASTTQTRDASHAIQANLEKRPLIEQKTALNLAQMAGGEGANLSVDTVNNLINTLIAEAPSHIVEETMNMVVKSSSNNNQNSCSSNGVTSTTDLKSLLILQDLIRKRIEIEKKADQISSSS
ncbi:MAG: hypothetical protein M1834_000768 [Cirrosporium novae-zelandiae]|nr:MAG: hypothetical protein M1834_000768 [Cirrosporium novae-zelandiae]